MGVKAWALCRQVANPAAFIGCVRQNVADARYVATATGANEGIVVLDMPACTNLSSDLNGIGTCAGGGSPTGLRWRDRDQVKFSPVGAAGRWVLVSVTGDAGPSPTT